MTADELKAMPKGHFIVTKTGAYPMRTRLKLFLEWVITLGKPYEIADQSARKVEYADRHELEAEIIRRNAACEETPEEAGTGALPGGMQHVPTQQPEPVVHSKVPIRIE